MPSTSSAAPSSPSRSDMKHQRAEVANYKRARQQAILRRWSDEATVTSPADLNIMARCLVSEACRKQLRHQKEASREVKERIATSWCRLSDAVDDEFAPFYHGIAMQHPTECYQQVLAKLSSMTIWSEGQQHMELEYIGPFVQRAATQSRAELLKKSMTCDDAARKERHSSSTGTAVEVQAEPITVQ